MALDDELHREVALEELQESRAKSPLHQARFVREAEITGSLEHPGIVPVYGLGRHPDGRPFYAMRFVHGESLAVAVERLHATEFADLGKYEIELRKLLRRFLDVCNAVAYAHSRGVIHRDLKPENVMLGPFGETLVVDWGVAKVVGRSESAAGELESGARIEENALYQTLPGSVVGTASFMSPEQAEGRHRAVGPTSDIYSLATLYKILTGKVPFEATANSDLLKRISAVIRPAAHARPESAASIDTVCLKAMAVQSEDRYPSARALAEDIEAGSPTSPCRCGVSRGPNGCKGGSNGTAPA